MITRFDRPGTTQHTGQFFQLNYEMLREPILKQDQEYKQTQDAWDTYAQAHAAQDYLKGDMEIASNKREQLYTAEKALRDSVGGDLLDPRYQQGMRSLVQNEANDSFYKNAIYNYKMYHENYLPGYQKYVEKYGEAPRDWQDQYGVKMRNYTNANELGKIDYTPIEARIPYQEKVMEVLKPILNKKIGTGEIYRKDETMPDGTVRSYLYKKEGGKVTKEDIKNMVKGSGMEAQRSYDQLQLDFNESPALQTSFSDFRDYYENGVLESIGNILAYEFSTETFQSWFPETKEKDPYSKRTRRLSPRSSKTEKPEIDLGPSLGVMGGASPTGYADYITTRKAKAYYEGAIDEFMYGYTEVGEDGSLRKQDNIDQRTLKMFGLEEGNSEGVKMLVKQKANSNNLSFDMTYTDSAGNEKTINLLGAEALIRKDELPNSIRNNLDRALPQMRQMALEYTKLQAVNSQLEDFKQTAGRKAFGDLAWQNMQKSDAPFMSLLTDPKDIESVNNTPLVKMAALIGDAGELDLQQLKDDAGPLSKTFQWIKNQISSRIGKNDRYEDDIYILSDYLGIDKEDWKKTEGDVIFAEDIDRFIDYVALQKNKGDMRIPYDLVDYAKDLKALDRLIDKGDPRAKKFEQLYSDHWQYGLDFNLERVGKEANPEGIRLQNRQIYHLNVDSSTGSHSADVFKKSTEELMGNILGYRLGGDGDQKSSYSGVELFNFATNKVATEDDYRELGRPDKDGNYTGFKLVGFAQDDEGLNLVVSKVTETDDKSNYFEIRDKTLVADLMIEAGMGSEVAIDLLKNAVNSFGQEMDDPYRPKAMSRGQSRSKAVGQIGTGNYVVPVERLMYPTQDEEGIARSEGTYRFYSETDGKYIYTDNMVDIVKNYMVDRSKILNESQPLQSFSEDTFFGKIEGVNDLKTAGFDMINPTLVEVLQSFARDVDRPTETLRMTSAYRPPYHELSEKNKNSKHILGNAVDMSIKNSAGDIDEDLLDWFFQQYEDLRQYGIKVQVEVNNLDDPKYKEWVEKYNDDFVHHVSYATDYHIHIEYDEAQYQKLMSQAAQIQEQYVTAPTN